MVIIKTVPFQIHTSEFSFPTSTTVTNFFPSGSATMKAWKIKHRIDCDLDIIYHTFNVQFLEWMCRLRQNSNAPPGSSWNEQFEDAIPVSLVVFKPTIHLSWLTDKGARAIVLLSYDCYFYSSCVKMPYESFTLNMEYVSYTLRTITKEFISDSKWMGVGGGMCFVVMVWHWKETEHRKIGLEELEEDKKQAEGWPVTVAPELFVEVGAVAVVVSERGLALDPVNCVSLYRFSSTQAHSDKSVARNPSPSLCFHHSHHCQQTL